MRSLVAVLAFGALAVPTSAQAGVTIAVVSNPQLDFQGTAKGLDTFFAYWGSKAAFKGAVVDDTGANAAGVTVHLLRRSGVKGSKFKQFATATTDADGKFTTRGKYAIDESTFYEAHIDADSSKSIAAASDSPTEIRIAIAAKLKDTSKTKQAGQIYRVAGKVIVPHPNKVGKMFLDRQRCGKAKFSQLKSKRPTAAGVYGFAVRHKKPGTYCYRLRFQPDDLNRYLISTLAFSVTYAP